MCTIYRAGPVLARYRGCGVPVIDACFVIDHKRASYRCASRMRIAADGTVVRDWRVHHPRDLGARPRGCAPCSRSRERKVDLRDGFSLNLPAGRLHTRILGSVAEYETEVWRDRREQGRPQRGPAGSAGMAASLGGFFKVTPDQIAAIRKMADEGQKIARVARITGLSRPTAYRVLNHFVSDAEWHKLLWEP